MNAIQKMDLSQDIFIEIETRIYKAGDLQELANQLYNLHDKYFGHHENNNEDGGMGGIPPGMVDPENMNEEMLKRLPEFMQMVRETLRDSGI